MRAPNSADLLDALDRGARATSAERALLLLETFRLEPAEQLAALPLGWVTARLLEFRTSLFGPAMECLSDCGECGTAVECEVLAGQLMAAAKEVPAGAVLRLQHDDYEVEFKLPGCADLLALRGDPDSAAGDLAQRLIGRASRSGEPIAAAEVPAELHAALERAVLEHDPLVQVELKLVCPGCGRRWTETLDVADFIWRELSVLGQGLFIEVARLAAAFGWRECDILAMSEQRRRRYLELLTS